jgi:hypothetical protein
VHGGEIIRYLFPVRCLGVLAAAIVVAACEEDPVLLPTEPVVCLREYTPTTYEVYFVIDVSGSMGPFLTDVKNELFAFAESLPEFDDDGRATSVRFFVIGFVNDVRWYPRNVRRLDDVLEVQSAFDEAIEDGRDNLNLNDPTFNAEVRENLLDALGAALANNPSADANLIVLATDAEFAEAPERLSGEIVVQASYPQIQSGLEDIGARVHAFTRPNIDGLTRGYEGSPALTALPGSTVHDITALTGARVKIRETLTVIAESADCN